MKPLAALTAFLLAAQGLAQVPARTQTFSLPNGLRVVLLEDHERPLVRARLHLPLERETAAHPGLAPLALRVLEHSDAGAFRVGDFEQLLAGAGIELTPALRSDGLSWSLLARSRDQDLALGLLADRAFRSIIDPTTLEAERLACWRETERLESSPRAKLRQLLEPDWTLQAPTLDSLTAVTYEDLLAFFARVLRPDRAVLVLQGDLGQEQAKRLVLLSFGTWTIRPHPTVPPPAGATPPPLPASAAAPPVQRVELAAPGLPPRALAVAVEPEDLEPEVEALLALLLPGDPALFPAQLRLEGLDLVATLEAEAPGSAPAIEASLLERLQALRQRGFTEVDLRHARAAWSAGRVLSGLHPEALVDESLVDESLVEARGRAVSAPRMAALTVETLNAGLRRWLDPARLRTGVLGGSAKP